MFWKHRLLALVVWVVATAVSAVVVYKIPTTFKASTVILVESQRIPEKFVSPTVNADLKDRLSTLSQQILSYKRLLEIIEKFDLYRDQKQSHVQEEIIEMMRSDIDIKVEEGWTKNRADARPGAFRISYQGPNPSVVALVANQLGNLFIEENLKAREVQATGTSEFLDNQTMEAKRRLEEQEAKLSAYKLQHNGELPQQETALLATLARLQLNLQSIQESIERSEQSKMIVNNSLEAAQASLTAMTEIAEQMSNSAVGQSGALTPQGEPVLASERMERQLEQLRTRYTDEHPDIQALKALIPKVRQEEEADKRRLAAARAAAVAAAASGKTAASEPGSRMAADPRLLQMNQALIRERERVENLKTQAAALNKQIENLQTDRRRIADQLAAEQRHLQNLPVREQQLTSVMRDYEISKANYQSLLDKRLAAQMATDMERRQKAESFIIIDAARVPERPFKPDRPLLWGISAVLALFLGLAGALVREVRTNALLGEWELPKSVPVLGRVPSIVTPAEDRMSETAGKHRLWTRRMALISSVLLLLVGIVAVSIYFKVISL